MVISVWWRNTVVSGAEQQKCEMEEVVAAIDIGTTFSGYAFSFRRDYEKDPTTINTNVWTAGTAALISHKTSTCALFEPDGSFHSFGYEAEDKYSSLALDDEHRDWFYIKRFKMKLYEENPLRLELVLEADNRKVKPALEVISYCIGYLKDHMMKTSKNRNIDIKESDILWVLTIPAIWSDPAKQFMGEAAEKAGIQSKSLIIALEPEAAALYSMHLPVEKFGYGTQAGFSPLSVGSKYIVLDAGGGTIDIAVHEVQPSGKLKELHKANGGNWGGTKVDEAFRTLLASIIGDDVMNAFCIEHKSDMLDLYRNFEVKKKMIKPESNGKIMFKVPVSMNETFKRFNSGKEIKQSLATKKKYEGQLTWDTDKLRMDAELAKGLYDNSIEQIINHLRQLLSDDIVKDCTSILMVGGYSESSMLQEAIIKNFENLRVIVPKEPGLSILKGAVIFGHNPSAIGYRVCKYTYGVDTSADFDFSEHDISKKYTSKGGEMLCGDLFSKHVEIGQTVVVGEPQTEKSYSVVNPDQTGISFDIYVSTEKDPKYVTDPTCTYLGEMTVDMPNVSLGLNRSAKCFMTFSGTELAVSAENEQDGKSTVARFDLLV